MSETLTLRQALESFYQDNAKYFPDVKPSPEAKAFLRCHDVAHVVFGCDTSLAGEGMVKLWTICGTTLGFWKHLWEYKKASAFELSRQYSWKHIVGNLIKLFTNLPRVFIRALKMNKRWDFYHFDTYMDCSLENIRQEFNIVPVDIIKES